MSRIKSCLPEGTAVRERLNTLTAAVRALESQPPADRERELERILGLVQECIEPLADSNPFYKNSRTAPLAIATDNTGELIQAAIQL